MPGHAGHRVPRRGAQARARRQARAAHRLRRHRGGDRRDQRGRARLLPAQAVGPARGAALPGRRGPADDLGGGRRARGRRRARHRPPLLAATRTTCATSSPATACRRAGSTSSATARRASCCRSPASSADRLPVALLEDGTVLERPTVLELAERLGVAGQPGAGPLRPRDRRRRPGRAGGRRLRRLGGPAHRAWSSARRPAGRPASRAGSRTTSASRPGLSGSDLARRATDQARRLGAELLTVQDAVAPARRGRRAASSSSAAAAR